MLTIEHKIKLLALLSIFVMVCGVIGISEPVSAAKVKEKAFKVDQGTIYFYDGQSGNQKMTWKTYLYYPSQQRKIFRTVYVQMPNKKYALESKDTYSLYKVSKNKMRIVIDWTDLDDNPHRTIIYKNTSLNTRMYYWYVFKKVMKKDPYSPYVPF